LGRLLPEGFIRTEAGKSLARPLHEEMQQWIDKWSGKVSNSGDQQKVEPYYTGDYGNGYYSFIK
jgi:hypothetical protein